MSTIREAVAAERVTVGGPLPELPDELLGLLSAFKVRNSLTVPPTASAPFIPLILRVTSLKAPESKGSAAGTGAIYLIIVWLI